VYYRLFLRIETFQWVTADSNKKSLPLHCAPKRTPPLLAPSHFLSGE